MQVKAEITVAVGVRHTEYLDVGNAWYWAVGADGQTVPRGQRQQDWSLKRVCRDPLTSHLEETSKRGVSLQHSQRWKPVAPALQTFRPSRAAPA